MKIASVVGARPQFIKASVAGRKLRDRFDEVLIHTGQHYDYSMSKAFFEDLSIPEPDFNLEIGSGPHGRQTGEMLAGIERVLIDVCPDLVLVYGDTNSTLAGALCAAKLHVPIGHVEAGLRSFNRAMPEEINRIVADHVSDLLFVPSQTAVDNLSDEGIRSGVTHTGDVMYDAILAAMQPARRRVADVCSELGVEPGKYALATVHRAENTDTRSNLEEILSGLGSAGLDVVFPCHPRTRAAMEKSRIGLPGNIHLIDPVRYIDAVALQMGAVVIATDSGGVQKEAYWLGVPCVTVRNETEWVETVDAGWNLLVGSDAPKIAEALTGFRPSGERPPVYGDGHAGAKIVDCLASWAGDSETCTAR